MLDGLSLRPDYENYGNRERYNELHFNENEQKNGSAYEDVLKEAQELGFAEADPTADVEGLDAARKMVILVYTGLFDGRSIWRM